VLLLDAAELMRHRGPLAGQVHSLLHFFFFQAEDGIRDFHVTGVQRVLFRSIHSVYGMTELLSQAYSDGEGIFSTPPWMKIILRRSEERRVGKECRSRWARHH